jgi:polyisoprenoid-binding protein YceI
MRFPITPRRLADVLAIVAPLTSLAPSRVLGQAGMTDSRGSLLFGTVSFDGHATLGDFTGLTSVVSGELSGGPALRYVRGWVEAPVNTLATGKGKRDADLQKVMEVDRFPVIRYELDSLTATAVDGDSAAVILHGRFIIHGVSREADLPGRVILYEGGAHVAGDAPLNLKDYRIRGLSRMLGLLKMHEEIEVHFDLTFATGPMALTARD